jgi:hypothetical protein
MKPKELKELSKYYAVALGILAYFLFKLGLDFYSNVALGLAASILSIWVTLEVIETALKVEREERNSTMKKITLKSLLHHIVAIIYKSPLAVASGISDIDSKLLNESAEKIRLGGSEQKKEVADAMVKLIYLVDQAQEHRKKSLSDLRKQASNDDKLNAGERDAFLISEYYQDIAWRIKNIREILIPRILGLVDEELDEALLNFERICDRYNEDMLLQARFKDYPIHSEWLIHFLKELAYIYRIIMKRSS